MEVTGLVREKSSHYVTHERAFVSLRAPSSNPEEGMDVQRMRLSSQMKSLGGG